MWVVPLQGHSEPDASTVQLIGGKAAGLMRLMRTGFRVPKGYVVTTEAYRRTIAPSVWGLETPEEMAEAVLAAKIPKDVEREIREIHRAFFDGQRVAVRSSATSEDGERLSFAGQLESMLQVEDQDAVLTAIKAVWASLFRRANLLYRGRVSLDELPPRVGVVIQEMLSPRAAGVLFTSDPVSGDPERLVISAARGLGQAVVGGVSTETVYVHLPSKRVIRHVLSDDTSERSLTQNDIEALIDAATRLGDSFDDPQDVEWAIDDEGLSFLQCRPITAGRKSAELDGPAVWTNANVGEALPGVATPMTWSIIRAFSRRGFEKAFGALGLSVPHDYELVSSLRGRIYINLSQFASIMSQIPFVKIADLAAVAGAGEAEEVEKWGYKKRSKLGFLARLPLTMSRMAVSQFAGPIRAHRWKRRFQRHLDTFRRLDLAPMTRAELCAVLAEIDKTFDRTGIVMLACGSNFLSSYMLTQQLLRRWGGTEAAAKEHYLFSGLRGLASAEPGLELLEMARFIREHQELTELFAETPAKRILAELDKSSAGRDLHNKLDRFLEVYGHRGAREAELSTPRWSETPTFLLEVIRSHLEAPYLPARETLAGQRERSREETTELIRQYFRPGFGLAFRWILGKTQENSRLREATRAGVTDSLGMYRQLFLEVGRRLTEEGALAKRDDVFFLSRNEVERFLDSGAGTDEFGATVAIRRAEYVAFSEAPDPPTTFVLGATDSIPAATQQLPPDTPYLEGLPASPGRVTGRARVIMNPSADAYLSPGEILIAPFTDVGWTPLFLVAGGVVTDMGGPLSHAAVVAREYGVAAVVNTKEATSLIKTGDLITLDGDAGRVYLKAI